MLAYNSLKAHVIYSNMSNRALWYWSESTLSSRRACSNWCQWHQLKPREERKTWWNTLNIKPCTRN